MNLNKILALTLMALLTACASTQEKEAQTAKEEQAQKALDELNRQVRSQSDMANSSAKQAAQSQKAIEELNKQLKDQSDMLTAIVRCSALASVFACSYSKLSILTGMPMVKLLCYKSSS